MPPSQQSRPNAQPLIITALAERSSEGLDWRRLVVAALPFAEPGYNGTASSQPRTSGMVSENAGASSDTVLITGASSGLGLALAQQLLDSEYRLILTAREASLDRFAAAAIRESDKLWLRPLDVTSHGQQTDVVEEAEERWGGVDILVNNAGLAYRSVIEHIADEERLAQMDINFLSPIELARKVLPSMRRKRRGRIINVSSVSGMMAMPTMAAYSASKWALEGATEALWYEVRPWGVHVSLVQPGFIRSPSFHNTRYTRASRRSANDDHEPYHEHYENMAPFIERIMGLSFATPQRVARTIVRTMRRRNPPLRVPATLDAHAFTLLRRLLPRYLYHQVLYHSLPRIRTWGPNRPARGQRRESSRREHSDPRSDPLDPSQDSPASSRPLEHSKPTN